MNKMKRFFFALLVLLMCAGCSVHQRNDDVYEYAKTMATGHIETVLGYEPESNYSLHKVQGTEDEFPYIYQVTKDEEPILLVEFEYDTSILYSGFSFDYGEGYLIPKVKDKYFRNYESDEYLYSVELNSEMDYELYQNVTVQHLDYTYHEEAMDKLMDYLSNSDLGYMCPDLEGFELHDGDLVQLGAPVLIYKIALNEENKTIEIIQINHFDYPVYINHELKTVFSIYAYQEEGEVGYGFVPINKYPMLKDEKLIRIHAGTLYLQELLVTEDGILNEGAVYPLYVDKALASLQDIVKDSDLSIEIVAARYIEPAGFSIENSVNPEAYRAAEDFVSSDYGGTVKIVDEDILYDPDYNVVAYNYALTYYGGGTGHAIVVKKGTSYIVNEASYGENPYEGLSKDVIKVYAGPFGYLYYLDNGMLMDLRTNEEVDPANVRRYKITIDN